MTLSAHKLNTIFLLFIAGTGGLLYGIDVGIIAGALPYLETTASAQWHLTTQELGFIVAAVLAGSVLSSLAAGALADWVGRKRAMFAAGLLFVISIPMMALADGYHMLLCGRLLQGISGGLVGVVVPLYMAECLDANFRGRGTALFQLLLTIGLVAAAGVGLYYARQVEAVTLTQSAQAVFAAKDQAWRSIFWTCLVPGIVFAAGTLKLAESPRWLHARGRHAEALKALLATRPPEEAQAELNVLQNQARGDESEVQATAKSAARDSLLSRRYVLPFLLACVILACNQATGINSILAYSVTIFEQAGLPGSAANLGDVAIKVLNSIMTVVAVILVDRKGRKFLLMLGTGGIVCALLSVGLLFQTTENKGTDIRTIVAAQVKDDTLDLEPSRTALQGIGATVPADGPLYLSVAYSYGDFANVQALRLGEHGGQATVHVTRAATVVDDSAMGSFFRHLGVNPFPDPSTAIHAPLHIERAVLAAVPDRTHGWLVMGCILLFIASFAVGPGVCVWLALSELMPTRIRSNGMSVALLINQFVSTTIAAIFLPTVSRHGYAPMFYFWAACTVVYFLVATFLLPETKGKTLEEIEAHFSR